MNEFKVLLVVGIVAVAGLALLAAFVVGGYLMFTQPVEATVSAPAVAMAPERAVSQFVEPPLESPAVLLATGQGPRGARIASWNVEMFMKLFDQLHLPARVQDRTELFRDEEDLYEVARTIKLPECSPDVLMIQECCDQKSLDLFNERWLGGMFATVKVFAGNTEGQQLAVMARKGWAVLEVKADYHKEADPVDDPACRRAKEADGLAEGNLLFPRGPAFVKLRSPGGAVLWVGTVHVKSKFRNSPAVTKWRIREIERTRQICGELLSGDCDKLIVMGDFNDAPGMDREERTVGIDAISAMSAGRGAEKLVELTAAIRKADPKAATYHCEIKPVRYRSFLDHAFASPALAARVRRTYLVDAPIAAVASDHYPVVAAVALETPVTKAAGGDAP